MKRYDLLTFGENMIRLSTRNFDRLEQAQTLDFRHGGTEANVAVGLARLGYRAAWVSRLGSNPLGRRIERDLAMWGVDTSHVVWAPDERVGVFFLEVGSAPRATSVYYDRRDSSMSRMRGDEFPWAVLEEATWLHATGITTAISGSCRELAGEAMGRARDAGLITSYDVNYRARLWTPGEARAAMEPLCRDVDIMFMKYADVGTVFGLEANGEEDTLKRLAERFCRKAMVMTIGARGSLALDKETGAIVRAEAHPVPSIVDRIGAGDAFAAGFIAGYAEEGVDRGLRLGNAMAALKLTINGDYALVSRAEVEALMQGTSGGVSR